MRDKADAGWRLAGLAAAWLAGVGCQLQQRSLWPKVAIVAAAALGVLALAAGWNWRRSPALAPLNWAACLGVAVLAFTNCGWRAEHRLADALTPALEGQDLRVTGVVATLPQRSPTGLRFRFEVEAASLKGEPVDVPELLALGWYKGQHDDAASNQPRAELRAGQRWRFTLRLRRPHGNLNPNGFDYELSLFEQGLRATGYVRDSPAAELLHRAAGHPVERLRQRVRDAIEASVPDRRAAGVLAALAVGDQGAIAREDWDLYRAAGIAHLVSISGLHITMFAWLSGLAIASLWRRSRRAALWLPTPWAARWGGLACAASYAVFSGWGVPSQRTVWMLATVMLLQTLGVRWPWPLVLLMAAVVVTAIDPWALMQAGFWLSFMAVGLLMASSSKAAESTGTTDTTGAFSHPAPAAGWHGRLRGLGVAARRTIGNDLRTQAIATIGLTPLTLVFFHQVSLIGFAANLIAIPLITLVVTPLALLGTLIVPLWALGAFAVQGLNAALGALAALPGAVWMAPVAPLWAQLAGLLGAVLLVLPLPWRARALALPLLIALLWPPRALPPVGGFDLWALDVGQGSALLVRTRAHLLVFDAGPQYSPGNDAGERVLLPLLRAMGESHVDRLVLSHRDLDHVGGAAALLKAMPVDEVLSSLEADHPLLLQAAKSTRCSAGQSWSWDGVQFEMLHPALDDYRRTLKSNAMSCVLRVTGSDANGDARSVLMTGDIEREQEAALVSATPDALRSSVLIAPHHGSRTSSSPAFLEAVAPRLAVFQAGYHNRFGHPSPDVVARYRAQGIATHATLDCGAWHWPVDGPVEGICERDSARRYWHDSPAQPARQFGEKQPVNSVRSGLESGPEFANLSAGDADETELR